MNVFFPPLYLQGDIHDIGVDLRSVCVRLRLGVRPLQHVGHIHSAGLLLRHRRLRDRNDEKVKFSDCRSTEEQTVSDTREERLCWKTAGENVKGQK